MHSRAPAEWAAVSPLRSSLLVAFNAEPTVRPAAVSDAAAIVALGRTLDRDQLATTESFRALLARPAPASMERLVLERGADGLIAWAQSGVYASGAGWFWIGVSNAHRRRGVGGGLYDRIEERLRRAGAHRVETTPSDTDGRNFLVARGFRVANVIRNSELDPRTVPPPPPRSDARTVSLAEAGEHAQALFALYSEAREDVPSATRRTPGSTTNGAAKHSTLRSSTRTPAWSSWRTTNRSRWPGCTATARVSGQER